MESRGFDNDNKQEDETWIDELIHQWLLSENDEFFTLTSGELEYDRLIQESLQVQGDNMMHLDTSKKQQQQQPLKRSTRLRRPTHKQ